jgi:hypothetical protein
MQKQGQATGNKHEALNDAKERAAGRNEQNPQLNPARDPFNEIPAKGQTGGAFGKEGHPGSMSGGRSPNAGSGHSQGS